MDDYRGLHEAISLAADIYWKNRKSGKRRPPPKGGEPRINKAKTCYNCGNVNHFIVSCPFENREEHGGRLIRKDKSKSFVSKNFVKKKVPNAFAAQERKVEGEYMSGDEDEDEVVGAAHVAIATSSSSLSSLFKSPNENAPSTPMCLMANVKVHGCPHVWFW